MNTEILILYSVLDSINLVALSCLVTTLDARRHAISPHWTISNDAFADFVRIGQNISENVAFEMILVTTLGQPCGETAFLLLL